MRILLVAFMLCLIFGMFVLADDTVPTTDIAELESIVPNSTNNPIIFGSIAAFIIPFIVGLLKKTLKLSKGIQPIVAFVIGIAFGVIVYFLKLVPELSLLSSVIAGAIVGGSSSGLYDIKKRVAIFLKNS